MPLLRSIVWYHLIFAISLCAALQSQGLPCRVSGEAFLARRAFLTAQFSGGSL